MPGNWIAVDWGTSHLRAWLMAGQRPVRAFQSDRGMGQLRPEAFEPALLELLGDAFPPQDNVTVIVCGMAGSRQGWAEAPYVAVPCTPPTLDQATRVHTSDPRLDVHILAGVKQERPADVMRGEETQIAGFLSEEPQFDGIICLPGTHSKWVRISAGEIVSFRTFMTGELFALLSGDSVLRHSVGKGWDDAAFVDAVADAMGRPAGFAAELFSLRAEGLLHDLSPDTARARLSGLLIGLELAAARPYWLGQNVVVLGASELARLYTSALAVQVVPARLLDAQELTLTGLSAAQAKLEEHMS
ncbi:MAG: 2-dehydro-3-deoxygalactonokinase [Paracoccaceae bacterium]|nr:2-dehydro-3-deoxygalactonokinase [Paracoccaceae bacterium]